MKIRSFIQALLMVGPFAMAAEPNQANTAPMAMPTAALAKAPTSAHEAVLSRHRQFTLADLKAQFPQSAEGNFKLEVPDICFTAGDKEVQCVLAGQRIETTGQVASETAGKTNGQPFRVIRLLTQCCAADARTYSVSVETEGKLPTPMAMSWIKLIGTISYQQINGTITPILIASEIREAIKPETPILK